MLENSDESSDSDPSVSEESSEDGYSNDELEYRYYINPIMRYVPKKMRTDVRRLCKDTARLHTNSETVKRITLHYRIVEDEEKTCMQKDCNKLTFGKCGTCHVFLCIDSENDCFSKFHEREKKM